MGKWVSTWGQVHTDITHISSSYKNRTMKLAVISCIGGSKVRLRVSNREGKKPYGILEAAPRIGAGPQKTVSFSGKKKDVNVREINIAQTVLKQKINIRQL